MTADKLSLLVAVATRYDLDGPVFEPRWGQELFISVQSGSEAYVKVPRVILD